MEHSQPAAISGVEPLATLIITPRERFSMAKRSLESILTNTAGPYQLVYVAGGAPAELRDYLQAVCADRGFDLVLRPEFLVPNAARNLGLKRAQTKYVVFIDNDVIVEPNWLDRLLACAEEEDADFVSPLCLEGEIAAGTLHTMGGHLKIEPRDGKQFVTELHLTQFTPAEQGSGQWRRLPIDYTEFHCALVRRAVFEKTGLLDEKVAGTTEHIDFALHLRGAGCRGFAEPNAVVSAQPADYTLGDLPAFAARWSDERLYPTLRYVAEKWSLHDDADLLRDFRNNFSNLRKRCLLRQNLTETGRPASPQEFFCAQTIEQLLEQMQRLGYEPAAVEKVRNAHKVATELFSVNQRANGRPALSHLIGVASVVTAFGANPAVIAAAVLHTAYTAGRFPKELDNNPAALRRWLRRRAGERVEDVVLAFFCLQMETVAQQYFPDHLDLMPIETANAIAIRMANAIEDRLCGDEHTFDPTTWLYANNAWNARWMPVFAAVAERLGFSGLTALLQETIAKSEREARDPTPRPPRPAWSTIDNASGARKPIAERRPADFLAPTEIDLKIEESAKAPPLAVDLAEISALNGGSVKHAGGCVEILADPQPWAYSACLPLHELFDAGGPGILEIRLTAARGRIGALLLERGSTTNQVAAEQFADQAGGEVTLRFRIPEFREAGNLVFRGWAGESGENRATISAIAVRAKTARIRTKSVWRQFAQKGRGLLQRIAAA